MSVQELLPMVDGSDSNQESIEVLDRRSFLKTVGALATGIGVAGGVTWYLNSKLEMEDWSRSGLLERVSSYAPEMRE